MTHHLSLSVVTSQISYTSPRTTSSLTFSTCLTDSPCASISTYCAISASLCGSRLGLYLPNSSAGTACCGTTQSEFAASFSSPAIPHSDAKQCGTSTANTAPRQRTECSTLCGSNG